MRSFYRIGQGAAELYWADCLETSLDITAPSGARIHVITDPPYEAIMHKSKKRAAARGLRTDNGAEPRTLDFDGIDSTREQAADQYIGIADGWFLAFCSPEGVAPWRDVIEAAGEGLAPRAGGQTQLFEAAPPGE